MFWNPLYLNTKSSSRSVIGWSNPLSMSFWVMTIVFTLTHGCGVSNGLDDDIYMGKSFQSRTTQSKILLEKKGLSGQGNDKLMFKVTVPTQASSTDFILTGGEGDADLFIRLGEEASIFDYDCSSRNPKNEEKCTVDKPGTYHILVDNPFDGYKNVMLRVIAYFGSNTNENNGNNPSTEEDYFYTSSEMKKGDYFSLHIPVGSSHQGELRFAFEFRGCGKTRAWGYLDKPGPGGIWVANDINAPSCSWKKAEWIIPAEAVQESVSVNNGELDIRLSLYGSCSAGQGCSYGPDEAIRNLKLGETKE